MLSPESTPPRSKPLPNLNVVLIAEHTTIRRNSSKADGTTYTRKTGRNIGRRNTPSLWRVQSLDCPSGSARGPAARELEMIPPKWRKKILTSHHHLHQWKRRKKRKRRSLKRRKKKKKNKLYLHLYRTLHSSRNWRGIKHRFQPDAAYFFKKLLPNCITI